MFQKSRTRLKENNEKIEIRVVSLVICSRLRSLILDRESAEKSPFLNNFDNGQKSANNEGNLHIYKWKQ